MITAASNTRIKEVSRLIAQPKARREQGRFVAEGVKMFLEAPEDQLCEVYVSDLFLDRCRNDSGFLTEEVRAACEEKLLQCGYETVADGVMRKISDTQTPQGVICVLSQPAYTLSVFFRKPNPLLLLLEDIQDPGNLGTMLRTAEGAGADGVLMSKGTADMYNPKTIRSTMGSVYRMPFLYTEDLTDIMGMLQSKGIRISAAHLQGAVSYDRVSYLEGCAILIGNEGRGLKEGTVKMADRTVMIPMAGQVESLNAAVASAVLLYEAARQRRA
ncbi:MAG: RNA methyltransferase [Lachnospiraceae bacterium]|nr:RNA methyltransferase [Lachnospiraceae bacterium]